MPTFPALPTSWGQARSTSPSLDLVSEENLEGLIASVEEMFDRSFTGYMTHAFPMDDLRPISCTGSDSQGGMAITLLDSLDMLYLMGRDRDLRKAVLYISKSLHFDAIDKRIHVFEVTIRAVGGLLSGHVLLSRDKRAVPWYNQELLDQAVNLADRLLLAFDTPTGVPEAWLNLHSGKIPGETTDTCTACAGTMILEFGVLSRLTGNPIYEEKARHAMVFMYNHRSAKGMVGTGLDTGTGEWSNQAAGVGASIDSYYEYLLKAYLMFGEVEYLDMFVDLYSSNRAYSALSEVVNGMVWPVDVHMTSGRVTSPYISSLAAFWPGMQVMAGQLEDAAKLFWHWDLARQKFGYLPESFTADLGMTHPTMSYYPLRPEHIESGYVLYAATHQEEFMAAVAEFHMAIMNGTRAACGYASVRDVTSGKLDDIMESFFISETLKYLYLLYTKRTDVLDQYVLSTEAHFLPTFATRKSSFNSSLQLHPDHRQERNERERAGGRHGRPNGHLQSCAAVCLPPRVSRATQHTLPVIDSSESRIRERRCDVCLALAEVIPKKKKTANYEWRAAARHPLKANLLTSAPQALALDEEEYFEGVRHFLCAMVYNETRHSVDCRRVWEVSLDEMNSQSLQMLPRDTVMFQLKGQFRREIDSLAKHIVELEVNQSTGASANTTKVIPAVLGLLGDRFFPGCTKNSNIEALKDAWSREMDAIFALDLEDQRQSPASSMSTSPEHGDERESGEDNDHKLSQTSSQSNNQTNHIMIPRVPCCQIEGHLIRAEPLLACSALQNVDEVRDGIVVVKRGDCTFQKKVIEAEYANARAMIVINENGRPFALESDPESAAGHPPVTIPSVMVGPTDGTYLLDLRGEARITIRQPDWQTRVEHTIDVLYGLERETRDVRKTCPPPPSIFSNATQRENLEYKYDSQVPLQLELIFASSFSTVHEQVRGGADLRHVLGKLAKFYQ